MDIVNQKALSELVTKEKQHMVLIFFDDDDASDYENNYKEWQENEDAQKVAAG